MTFASVLGVAKYIATELNDINDVGLDVAPLTIYKVNNKPANAPSGFSTYGGFIIHCYFSASNKFQIAISFNVTTVSVRTYWGDNWMPWKDINLT